MFHGTIIDYFVNSVKSSAAWGICRLSMLLCPQLHGVFAVLLLETFGEIARRAEAHLVGNLLYGLVGSGQQHVGLLQAHLP